MNTNFHLLKLCAFDFAQNALKAAMSNPRSACGPVEGFVWPGLGFLCNITSLDNLKFANFDAGGPQCHFITSVPRAGGFPYVH